jgi:hypothetical protein
MKEIKYIETYRGYKIVFDTSWNEWNKTNNLYTVCGLGRDFDGPIENVRAKIDMMFEKYNTN